MWQQPDDGGFDALAVGTDDVAAATDIEALAAGSGMQVTARFQRNLSPKPSPSA